MSRLEQAEALLVRAEDWLSDMNDPPLCVVDDIRAFLAAAPRSTLGDVLCERLGLQRSITADAQPGDDSAEADGLAVDTFKAAQLGPLWKWNDYRYWESCEVWPGYKCLITERGEVQFSQKEVHRVPQAVMAECLRASLLAKPADSAPPAEPSIAELAAHRWRIGDMFCRPECNKVRLVYALDDALALVKYIREDGVLDQCNAAILASWVQVSGCALGNLFDKLRTLDAIEQRLSDLAAKVEALSKPQVEAVQFEAGERVLAWLPGVVAHYPWSWQIAEYDGTPDDARPGVVRVCKGGVCQGTQYIAKLPPAPDAQAQEGQR